MFTNYYYFMSSLPTLTFSGEGAPSYEDFMQRCRINLSEHDLKILGNVSLIPKAKPDEKFGIDSALRRWEEWCTSMRNAIVRWRSRRLGELTGKSVNLAAMIREGEDPYTEYMKRLSAILDIQDARRRQDEWEALQWNFLHELELLYYYNFSSIVVYSLKLQIIEKRRRYNTANGTKVLEKELARLTAQASANRTVTG